MQLYLGLVFLFFARFCSGALSPPGEPPATYGSGKFDTPDGSVAAYMEGTKMNVSWSTAYPRSNLWLVVNEDFNDFITIADNITQQWHSWDVTAHSSNASATYVFRIINPMGPGIDQTNGGFLSATFWVKQGNAPHIITKTLSKVLPVSSSGSVPVTMTPWTTTTTSTAVPLKANSSTVSVEANSSTVSVEATKSSTVPGEAKSSTASSEPTQDPSRGSSTDAPNSSGSTSHVSSISRISIGMGLGAGVLGLIALGQGLYW